MENLISLCMIVKNEEKVLRRCLESVKDLVDEIIIVDTGSTDQTKAIASEYTSFIYDYEWIKDFSAARNESIRKATTKWILCLDADEYVQQEDKQKLRDYLTSLDATKPTVFILPVMNILGESEKNTSGMMESSMVRLFPNNPDICFNQPIHEQITFSKGQLSYLTYSFFIFHTGYTHETATSKNKSQRNLEIFETMKTSKKLNPYYNYSLGNEYSSVNNFKKSIYYYEKAFNQAKPDMIWYKHCLDAMVNTYFSLNRFKDAYNCIQTGLSQWPEFTDFHFYSGLLYHYLGLYEQAKDHFYKCIQISEQASINKKQASLVRLDSAVLFPGQKLVDIFEKELDPSQTVYYLSKVLQSNPNNYSILLKLIQMLTVSEDDSAIIQYLEKMYPPSILTNTALLFRIMLLSAKKTLAEYYYEKNNSLNNIMGKTELLHYALIINDPIQFKLLSQQLSEEQRQENGVCKIFHLAALIWREPNYLTAISIPDDKALTRVIPAIQAILEELPLEELDEQEDAYICLLIVELFNLQFYETFDWFMTLYSTTSRINLIANYFFSIQNFDLALDYYSLLLEKDQLSSVGYENLARLYFKQGETEEGISFLEKAIELNPVQINLYLYLCAHCGNQATKELYKAKFIKQFPQHKNLPFIKAI
jgi:glycosyltransferase involved in cell wall biosynthesis